MVGRPAFSPAFAGIKKEKEAKMKKIKEQIKELGIEELKELKNFVNTLIEEKKEGKVFRLETINNFDARKHGHAYVAKLCVDENGKVDRKFFNMQDRIYDSKRKYYQATWEIELKEGDIIEARLDDGSWKNDYRNWFIVENGELKEISQKEARELLRA